MGRSVFALVAVLLALAVMYGCSADSRYGKPTYTFEDLRSRDELVGKDIRVIAVVHNGSVVCTSLRCPRAEPCCNRCTASLFITGNSSSAVKIQLGKPCSGTNCNITCPISEGYRVLRGQLSLDSLRLYTFNVDYYT